MTASERAPESARRLHPITPLFDLIASARQLSASLGLAVFGGEWWYALPILLLTGVRAVRWLRFTYQVDGEVVRTTEGLLVRKNRTLPLDRIQQVDVVSKLRHRMFGVVALHVDTASGARGAELELAVVTRAEGERLRRIFERRSPAAPTAADAAAPPEPVVSLAPAQLALAGVTGAQTLVILSLLYSLQEVAGVVDVGRLRALVPDDAQSDPVAIAVGVLGAAATWLGLAAAAQILTHYDFKLRVGDGEFHVTRGLLDRREVGGSVRRVQAVRVEQTLVRRVFHFVSIRVQTAAVPGQDVSRVVIPYVHDRDVERVVRALLPEAGPWPVLPRTPHSALLLATLRRVPVTVFVSVAVAAVFWPWGAGALLAVPIAVAAAFLHWSAHGFAIAGTTVWARSGGLFRQTIVLPTARAQSLRFASSPLQRRVSLATLRIDLAGSGGTPRIQDARAADLEAVLATAALAAVANERSARATRL